MLLQENGISLWNHSFAIVNALIFGKVILIGRALDLGRSLKEQALAWIVLGKSLMFSIAVILFHIAEEAIRARFKGIPLSTSIEDFGGGTWLGLLTYAAIFFVALIPFSHSRKQLKQSAALPSGTSSSPATGRRSNWFGNEVVVFAHATFPPRCPYTLHLQ